MHRVNVSQRQVTELESLPAPVDLALAASQPIETVFASLGTTTSGLSTVEAQSRLVAVGHNVLVEHRVTVRAVLARQLRNPLLILLGGAAAVSAVTGDATDAIIIATISLLSVGLGFTNEYRSELAAMALHSNIRHQVVTWRNSQPAPVNVADLVPGDVVELSIGTIVPADLRLITTTRLECDEAVLTGESAPATKSATPSLPASSSTSSASKSVVSTSATSTPISTLISTSTPPSTVHDSGQTMASCAFMGTVVRQGSGTGVVVATGSRTAFGRIAAGLNQESPSTAFQRGLKSFSKLLVVVAGVLTTSIFFINVALHRPLIDALLFSLAIAIGITPQLLPAIVSVSLAGGARRLAKSRVLVKRLVTIEDLCNIELLFTDKTGTLTEGAITFDRSLGADGTESPEAFLLGLLCNEASPSTGGPVGGNALDQAMYRAPKAAAVLASTDGPNSYQRIGSLPFDHDRQLASVAVTRTNFVAPMLITKGAPEVVLARCVNVPSTAVTTLAVLFADGARTIAIATRTLNNHDANHTYDIDLSDEQGLSFQGFLTFVDRAKPDAGAAIEKLKNLGIDVKIITGDNGAVASKVCRDIGMTVSATLTGEELDKLSDDALAAAIPCTTVFARVNPDQKARVVKVARRDGVDVAFMGDGVNDAVALHMADVGISVESATDVAKDAADIVLLDKDLGVLAAGVMEGRRIFANTLKYVLMATSSNFGNMFSAAGASIFLSYLPMLPSQILLNGLLYDVGQLAIPTDKVDPEVLARPAGWDIAFVRRFMLLFGPISSVFDIATFLVMIHVLHAGRGEFRAGWFIESIVTQTLVIYLIRTRRIPFFRSKPSKAMMIAPLFVAGIGIAMALSPIAHSLGFARLPIAYFFILFAMIAVYLVLIECAKAWFYRADHQPKRHELTPVERHDHRVRRRAARFVRHTSIRRTHARK
jgi:P-type Mg2+ transporter